ncbi:IS3 family transposase [Clostridium sp. A1-XYC3]|uniref:IS3 family transposase n=1 Tax=Clostridium tanneri TaxID=3037988 RepID=A0ABU4JZ47_9CLOT|nr:IS3 family transposase [Clostridium sp. A1-XYC3]MDW8803213.1 IS3 family transposase [Clostridium sp. A1-XYC3]
MALAKEYTQKGIKTSRACTLLQISRSAFYPKKETMKNEDESKGKVGRPIPGFSYGINNCIVDDSVIETLLHEACERLPFYGYKKITRILRRNHGLQINAKKVYRLAKKLGLLLPYVKHTKQGHLAVARDITDINQLWQIDIKYVKALNGQFIMLTDMIDVHSRKLVGREITKTATTNDAIVAVKRALLENEVTSKLILRSDNGPQFTSVKFEHFCKTNNIYHELIPTNSPNYNAHIESFHSLLSKECIAWNEIKNFTHGYMLIDEYIKFYNEERIHGSLNYMSPNEFIKKSMS